MNIHKDPMGRAIADYFNEIETDRLRVFSPMFEEDEIPLSTLFREYNDMPEIEQKALNLVKGKVLDVGAGAGCHSLVLQKNGFYVTAIDISPLSVETMKQRGIKNVFEKDFFEMKGRKFDTILMLMNGIGIVGSLKNFPLFFKHLNDIMTTNGQLICDSSDISYIFETNDGYIELPNNKNYYGELSYQLQYKNVVGEPFSWLYIDAETLKIEAENNGFNAEIVAKGNHYDYLARITKKI